MHRMRSLRSKARPRVVIAWPPRRIARRVQRASCRCCRLIANTAARNWAADIFAVIIERRRKFFPLPFNPFELLRRTKNVPLEKECSSAAAFTPRYSRVALTVFVEKKKKKKEIDEKKEISMLRFQRKIL